LAKSPQRRELLAEALLVLEMPVPMPVYPAKTRWNSHYDALRRFLEIYPALRAIAGRVLKSMTAAQINQLLLQEDATVPAAPYVLATLEPSVRWTSRLSAASTVTLSLVPRAVGELLNLSMAPIVTGDYRSAVANVLRARLADELRRIFAGVLDPLSGTVAPAVHLARFLDPRRQHGRHSVHRRERGRHQAHP
jgi:hypothetical protein